MNRNKLQIITGALALIAIAGLIGVARRQDNSLPLGNSTINVLPQFTATSTPYSAIATRPFGKNVHLIGSHVTTTALTVLDSLNCDSVDTDATGRFKCGVDATGAGGGTGSNWVFSPDQTYITPSTSVGILANASSSISLLRTESLVVGSSLSGTGFTNAWNTLHNATSTYPGAASQFAQYYNATTTLSGFTNNQTNWNTAYGWGDHSSAGYFLTSNFATSFASSYNATTTLSGFTNNQGNWNTAFGWGNHALGGYASSTGMFAKYGTLAELQAAVSNDFHNLGGIDATGGGAAWEKVWLNAITPTSTTAGIFVNASSTFNSTLRVNGAAILANASSTNFAITGYGVCSALETNAAGTIVCGTDDVGAGGGEPGAWHTIGANILSPTSTGAAIVVNAASSTITSLRVPNGLQATTSAIDILTIGTSLIIDANTFDSLTDDATLSNNSGDLQVVNVTCTGCIGATQLDESGDWTGTFDGFQGSAFALAGVNGAWQIQWPNALSPTSTTAGIYIKASSTIDSTFRVTGAITATNLVSCNTIDTSAAGLLSCGTDEGAGFNGVWQNAWAGQATVRPTSTTAGIYVTGSSTIDSTLRVTGAFSAISGTASSTFTHSIVADTDTLIVNANENRVGILTASPTTTLGVVGTSRFNGAVTITGALTVNSITGSTQCLQIDTNGLLSGAGAACGTGAPGQNGAWQMTWTNALAPTSTTSGIYVKASSTIDSTLRVTGNMTLAGITGVANNCLQVDTNGLISGVGAACGLAGQNGAWQILFTNALSPTSTTAGIFVNASSTFNSTLRVNGDSRVGGNATTTGSFDAAGGIRIYKTGNTTTLEAY